MSGHEHNGANGHHGPRPLPATLTAPENVVSRWRTRMLIVAALGVLLTIPFGFSHEGKNHIIRAYLMGWMTCFGFAGGGLCMLMLQHVTGGKWGLLLRRPLEAMSRTLWGLVLLFIPIAIWMKHLYQWAAYPTAATTAEALSKHWITLEQALTANDKRPMLSPVSALVQFAIAFAILLTFTYFLNKWSLQRDADPLRGTQGSFDRWRIKFENLSGIGILIYVILLTDLSIVWIKSLDVTWYSSIYGLQFLVGQGYAVLALGILIVIMLSRYEPMKTLLRVTEQHDLGKLALAFVMLNIYLCFAEFLIIWSGNIPDEIPWYLNRIHGGWWYICSLDFIAHWLIPFCLLLSRDLKRNKKKMIWLASWMIFARFVDMFWLIEPNFRDAAGNLHIHNNAGILAYITVPVAVVGIWAAYFLTELKARPLVNVNDPHLEEMLEPEHVH
ncbi:hypothetical protein GCM10011507_23210 [Edaphobacter acidisoli]|uniref:Quinol:cytochrome c oxidoreductase quinone-binding subunit 2 n=1 Tax=Edaphobacter acidisoli TaxID=2040573 RepID=A0A916RVA6_9BACT|nr:hypothetical protein [Edaphobacter acidisoli]GGA70992.1 hypothetical protein GCM10011507_23210 [Edaphobacter acidisoli]